MELFCKKCKENFIAGKKTVVEIITRRITYTDTTYFCPDCGQGVNVKGETTKTHGSILDG